LAKLYMSAHDQRELGIDLRIGDVVVAATREFPGEIQSDVSATQMCHAQVPVLRRRHSDEKVRARHHVPDGIVLRKIHESEKFSGLVEGRCVLHSSVVVYDGVADAEREAAVVVAKSEDTAEAVERLVGATRIGSVGQRLDE